MGHFVEQAILYDYLRDTSATPPHPFSPPVVTRTDWWDAGNQQHYKEILLLRHTHVNEKRLRALRRLKVPDISTWQGQYRRNGAPVAGHDGARNELYEVKPDTVWGEAAGKEKLKGIDDNFNELAVSGYHRGSCTGPARPNGRSA